MKAWTSTTAVALGLGLAATAISSTSAAPVMFNRHFMAGNAKHSNRIEFNTVEMQPVPHYMLADAGKLGDALHPMCKYTETNSTTQANTTVLIAISKCLNDSSIALIEQWITTLKATEFVTGRDGVKTPLTFATTLVQGDCEARTERQNSGREEEDDTEIDEDDSAETKERKRKAKEEKEKKEAEEKAKKEAEEKAKKEAEANAKSPKLLSADLSKHLLSQQVHPDELVRIQAFAKFGRVLADAPSMANTQTPIAVVSFVNNKNSYDYVEKYENRYQIKNTFNFQLCEGGENCDGKYENCVKLKENIELFMFNPFQVVRSFGCKELDGSIPVTYVDAKGNRACYCRCPAGFESTSDSYYGPKKCAKVEPDQCPCVWNDGTKPHANKICNEENLTVCKFTDLASKWKVAVPFPLDNYVSDERVNSKDAKGDNVKDGPHIDLVVTPLYKTEYKLTDIQAWHKQTKPTEEFVLESLPPSDDEFKVHVTKNAPPSSTTSASTTSFTWRVYQDNSQGKIDDIELKAYGKYQLELGAYDYARNAKCVGCVAVVDKFRPVNTTQCPVRVCDNSTGLCHESNRGNVEYTDANLDTLNGLVDSFYKFQSKSTNDACNTKRCDDETFELQNWFESKATKKTAFDKGAKCFTKEEIEKDFMSSATAKTNPLADKSAPNGVKQNDKPVNANQCTRCCEYGVKLQEWWTDYKCNYEYDVAQCSGNNDYKNSNCDLKQCLVLKGDTLASVTAKIKPSVTTESEKVLAKLESQGFQTYTQVHRALQCTGFGQDDGKCDYSATIGELLDVTVDNKFGDKKADYVFWRYKVKGEDWRLWNPSDNLQTSHKFSTAATKITLEAWTACGRARKFYFYVHLHVHSDIKVCDYFNDMWYQTTVSRAKIGETATDALCAYPGSDFAELTFDYQANIGLKHARDQLRMNVTGVECKLMFKGRTDAQIVSVKGESMDIIERFAVELQNQATTAATTAFNVECKFTYTRFDQEKLTHSCKRAFTIQDCDAPTIDTPPGECLWDDCAGQGKPGPYEVCDGNVVSATATATYMTTASSTCCQSCKEKGVKTTCTTILDLPTGAQDKDIKRCVPEVPQGMYVESNYGNGIAEPTYGSETEYTAESMMLLAKAAATTHSTAMGLLAASAMVAVVALVAVRQRRAQAARDTMIVDDAYYPLLH